jgi:hypothetical protein
MPHHSGAQPASSEGPGFDHRMSSRMTRPLADIAEPEPKRADGNFGERPGDLGVQALRAAYRASGGVARGDDLARLLDDLAPPDPTRFDGLVDDGTVFGFDWRGALWVPMFQFELADLSVRLHPLQVRAELEPRFDAWQVAVWFARRNPSLGSLRPVDLVNAQLPWVLSAARIDRQSADAGFPTCRP